MAKVMEDVCGRAGNPAQLSWASPVIPTAAQHLHKLDYIPPKQIHARKISSEPSCATPRPIGNVSPARSTWGMHSCGPELHLHLSLLGTEVK